jgi:hypothetical protein
MNLAIQNEIYLQKDNNISHLFVLRDLLRSNVKSLTSIGVDYELSE